MRAGDVQTVVSNIANVQQARQQAMGRADLVPREASLEVEKEQAVKDKTVNSSEESREAKIRKEEERRRDSDRRRHDRREGESSGEEGGRRDFEDGFRGRLLDVEA